MAGHARRLWAVIAAAGTGQRMGQALPKQYQTIAGRSVLAWSVDTLLSIADLNGLMIAHSPGDRQWRECVTEPEPLLHGCEGGATRAQSVQRALAALKALGAGSDDWVLVHDAARPAVAKADIDRLIAGVGDHPDGGLLAVPVRDTLKRGDANARVEATISREHLWQALTPQYFPLGRLAFALDQADPQQTTDEAQAMEQMGASPQLIAGLPSNIKLTTPADEPWLAATLAQRSANEAQ